MKLFTLAGLLALPALCISAAAISQSARETNIKDAKAVISNRLAAPAKAERKEMLKKLRAATLSGKRLSPVPFKSAQKAPRAAEETDVLFESFEGWDGVTEGWLPEGWTLESRTGLDPADSWQVNANNYGYYPAAADGNYYMGAYLTWKDNQDEWLITPQFDVPANATLEYYLYLDPVYLFSFDNLDWDTGEFLEEPEVCATVQIWAREDGADWEMVSDVADYYKNLIGDNFNLQDLQYLTPNGLQKMTAPLGNYAGKKINVAFRYVGSEGNCTFLDAVRVGMPSLEGISYMNPFTTLYWGMDGTEDYGSLSQSVAMFPAFEPITWSNMSYADGVTYSWNYTDPVTHADAVSDDQYELTLTYFPDYSSEQTKKNNFYMPPTLIAEAPGMGSTQFTTNKYFVFHAGGKPEMTFNSGDSFEVDMLPFDVHSDGLSTLTVDYEEVGDLHCPIFGHDENSDDWWLRKYTYMYGGEPEEGEYVKQLGIINFIFPTEQPLVVNGVNIYGRGSFDPDAELTASIYALPDTYEFFGDETPLATATVKGSDVLVEDANDFASYVCIPVHFDTPAVIKATDENPAYIVMFSGFNSDKVEYFAPFQAYYPHADFICHGYTYKETNVAGRHAFGVAPIANISTELGDCYSAFAMGLDAEYPWLELPEGNDIVSLPANGEPVSIALGSYYHADKYTVEVPTGLDAELTGRYDECVLTLTPNAADVEINGNVVLRAPGIEKTIMIQKPSGVANVSTSADATVMEYYDLSGRLVKADGIEPGIYVAKYSDGSARKIVIR